MFLKGVAVGASACLAGLWVALVIPGMIANAPQQTSKGVSPLRTVAFQETVGALTVLLALAGFALGIKILRGKPSVRVVVAFLATLLAPMGLYIVWQFSLLVQHAS